MHSQHERNNKVRVVAAMPVLSAGLSTYIHPRRTRTQEVRLFTGYPLLSNTNKGELNKNERWEVTEMREEDFSAKRIAINDEKPDEQPVIDVPYAKFHDFFEPGWCITTHKAQGMTITERYTIYNIDGMDRKLMKVAISRAKSEVQVFDGASSQAEENSGKEFEDAFEETEDEEWGDLAEEAEPESRKRKRE